MQLELNGKTVVDIEIDGVDPRDYPDFCDAYFSFARYEDGKELSNDELDQLYNQYPDELWNLSFKYFH
jgi:hypothetical protein